MSDELTEKDAQRARWSEFRESQLLLDPKREDYAMGGLGVFVEKLDARLLFLPADPSSDVVSLDDETIEWLKTERPSPYQGAPIAWGFRSRATGSALVVYDQYREDGEWNSYLAVHRHGGVEFGRSRIAYMVGDVRAFSLRHVVGLVWTALDIQVEGAARWKLAAPYEMTLALRNTRGSTLGGLAEGWSSPSDFGYDLPTCMEDHVLLRWELDEEFDVRDLAMDVGDRVEQAFGSTHRRHLAHRGDFEGQFDPRF